ncbi:MAG: enoyl-CoA hydratase/isomerase family protein [Caldilineaceae bacterium]|nr:enoyl-CoA hydratase/isomerase family protein [Caldilineaceae bacterium]
MEPLLVTIADDIATIVMNRPEQHNAITYEMWTQFAELFSRLDSDDDVRMVIVRGSGEEAFSAGGDISEFEERRGDPWQAKIYNGKVELALRSLGRLRKPTIAAIKGYCVGAGFMLAAYCDLRLAADNAVMGVPVAKLGALVSYYELERMIQLIGLSATLDLLLTARLIDAEEARSISFCSRVVPVADLDGTIELLIGQMHEVAPLTQQWHKQMAKTILRPADLDDLDPEETTLPDLCYDTEDYAEGVMAFLQKRKPVFHGR